VDSVGCPQGAAKSGFHACPYVFESLAIPQRVFDVAKSDVL
jgi:hypothetical protein